MRACVSIIAGRHLRTRVPRAHSAAYASRPAPPRPTVAIAPDRHRNYDAKMHHLSPSSSGTASGKPTARCFVDSPPAEPPRLSARYHCRHGQLLSMLLLLLLLLLSLLLLLLLLLPVALARGTPFDIVVDIFTHADAFTATGRRAMFRPVCDTETPYIIQSRG